YVLDEWYELVDLRRAEVVVVHVGIVDCAPRVFLRRERQFVENLRPAFLREAILSNVHRHRRAIVNLRKKVYVPPEEMDERSPGFIKNAERYNQILKTHAEANEVYLIDIDRMIKEAGGAAQLTVDGIHLNEVGHAMLAREIENHVVS